EACMEVLRFASTEFAIQKLQATPPEADILAARVLRKIGMIASAKPKIGENRAVSYILPTPIKVVDTLFESTYLSKPKITAFMR
ncbi:MAG: hypothetical protein ABI778_09625, partial [Ignavibacteriota bacterium]